jgi:hypothetical protein
MKANCFNFVVHTSGRLIAGGMSTQMPIGIARMTQLAAWSAQETACEEGWEFDLLNFAMAIQPIIL